MCHRGSGGAYRGVDGHGASGAHHGSQSRGKNDRARARRVCAQCSSGAQHRANVGDGDGAAAAQHNLSAQAVCARPFAGGRVEPGCSRRSSARIFCADGVLALRHRQPDGVTLPHGERCRGNSRLESGFLGLVRVPDFTIVVDVPGTVPANNIIGCEAHGLSLLHASGVALEAWVLLTGSDAGKLSFKALSSSSSLALSRRMPCLRSSAFLSGGAGSNFSVTQVSFRYLKRLELPTVPFEEQRSRGLLSNGKNQKAPAARALSFRLHLLL